MKMPIGNRTGTGIEGKAMVCWMDAGWEERRGMAGRHKAHCVFVLCGLKIQNCCQRMSGYGGEDG